MTPNDLGNRRAAFGASVLTDGLGNRRKQMELRIFRTFEWVIGVPLSEVRFGGRNPMKLKHTDELQWRSVTGYGEWQTVPIVEADKPEHPDDKEARVRNEEMQATVDRMLADGTIKFPNVEVEAPLTALQERENETD